MKSYFVELTDIGKSHLNNEKINTDDLQDNEAIIKSEYSLISAGTELSRAFALKQGFKYPVRPGYSTVGKIIAKGKDIKADIGDRVFASSPHASITRWSNTAKTQGAHIYKLPEGIDPKEATSINLGLVALQGVNMSQIKLGYKVGIFGLGNIGIMAGLMYQKLGCKVTGFDVVENRCVLAEKMGLKNTCSRDYETFIDSLTDNEGFDITVDVTGLSSVIIDCVKYTRRYGQVILLGSPRQAYETDVTPLLSNIHMKNLQMIGAFNQSAPVNPVEGSNNSVERNFAIVCDLIMNKDIDVSKLISKVIDPKDCQQAYYDLMYNKDKVNCIIFDWNSY
ncbi:MAG: zinc-binding alcohol dehydrogenase [Erysipelotrichaceae bacterium]|nr:zinc-binding alcohol dehydrogenase [Erysipelotrichaceae bacterium]